MEIEHRITEKNKQQQQQDRLIMEVIEVNTIIELGLFLIQTKIYFLQKKEIFVFLS